jgi:hypothetical protein
MLFVASIGIAFWLYSNNMRRVLEIHRARAQAEAERTIVVSLFPDIVREQLLLEGAEAKNTALKNQARLKKFGDVPEDETSGSIPSRLTSEGLFGSKPIADYHPECSLMFADLKGFTAWREFGERAESLLC